MRSTFSKRSRLKPSLPTPLIDIDGNLFRASITVFTKLMMIFRPPPNTVVTTRIIMLNAPIRASAPCAIKPKAETITLLIVSKLSRMNRTMKITPLINGPDGSSQPQLLSYSENIFSKIILAASRIFSQFLTIKTPIAMAAAIASTIAPIGPVAMVIAAPIKGAAAVIAVIAGSIMPSTINRGPMAAARAAMITTTVFTGAGVSLNQRTATANFFARPSINSRMPESASAIAKPSIADLTSFITPAKPSIDTAATSSVVPAESFNSCVRFFIASAPCVTRADMAGPARWPNIVIMSAVEAPASSSCPMISEKLMRLP